MPQGVGDADGGVAQAAGPGTEDERLRQRVLEGRAGDLRDEPGERNREGQRGQHERAEAVIARHGEPAEDDGEHHREHDAHPELGERGEENLDASSHGIENASPPDGQQGEGQRDDPREDQREAGQLEGGEDLRAEDFQDRHLEDVGRAEVPGEEAAEVGEVLDEDGLVEAVLGLHRRHGLGRRRGTGTAEDRRDRIARGQPEDKERQRDRGPEDEDAARRPLGDDLAGRTGRRRRAGRRTQWIEVLGIEGAHGWSTAVTS